MSNYLKALRLAAVQQAIAQGKTLEQANRVAETKTDELSRRIKLQRLTNIFFLPASSDGAIEERIAILDRPFAYSPKQWKSNFTELLAARQASLTLWAYYLLVFKLSFHLCRLPEEPECRD